MSNLSIFKRRCVMKKWLYPASYPATALFLILGLFSVLLAWSSFGLLRLAMANFTFIQAYGSQAIYDGGLVQLLHIGFQALLALLSYLGFKGVETELVARWRSRDEH